MGKATYKHCVCELCGKKVVLDKHNLDWENIKKLI